MEISEPMDVPIMKLYDKYLKGNLINKHVMNNFYLRMLPFLAVILEGLSDHFFDRKYNSMSIRLCPNIVILYFFLNDQLVC